jgi:hypothetical protein
MRWVGSPATHICVRLRHDGARKLFVEGFTAEIIGRQTVAFYKRVINKTLDADHSLLL